MNVWRASAVRAIESVYPRALAAAAWDNTGLLLEAPEARPDAQTLLLTIDLTPQVAAEALADRGVGLIVAYHPIIFRGLKSITCANPQQKLLLQLATAGISVYSPHTAVDAALGGNNDWILDSLLGTEAVVSRSAIEAIAGAAVEGHEGAGYGRAAKLARPMSLQQAVGNVKRATGLQQIQIALADSHRAAGAQIQSVAVCAGSGGGVLKPGVADLCVTGELSHHELLAMVAQGTSVIVLNHSNSERGYLSQVMRGKLQDALRGCGTVGTVAVSVADRDPLEII